jgi:hypothetical protein
MTYLREDRVGEVQHVSTPNGSSSGADSFKMPNLILDPYCRVVLCFELNLVQDLQN